MRDGDDVIESARGPVHVTCLDTPTDGRDPALEKQRARVDTMGKMGKMGQRYYGDPPRV